MAIDRRFIPAFSIEDVILDKDTGEPLAGGQVYFEQDNNRGVLKAVYQISGISPNYTFAALPNPMTLSAIGTFVDSLENPVIPYFYPFDSDGAPEYYYIRVVSAGGVEQFTREAQPYIADDFSPGDNANNYTNELSNPQFSEVSFDTTSSDYVFNFSGASLEVNELAPDWDLVVSGTGTVTVKRVAPQGTLNRPTNAPYFLDIDSGGVSYIELRQRLYGSPNLFGSEYVSGLMVGKTFEGTATPMVMEYRQSNGIAAQTVIDEDFPASGNYTTLSNSVLIPASTSTETAPDAWVEIAIIIPVGSHIQLSSIQFVGTGSTSVEVPYDETTYNRQIDYLFHYYKPQLEYKPIPSYLVGWDFPLNPAQFATGSSRAVAATAIGANKSKYVWDQTIIFQSANSGVGVTSGSAGEIVLTAAATTQMALIQYLPQAVARKILNEPISLNIAAKASVATNATVSLWYTTDASLPDISGGTNNSIVATLGTDGTVATQNGNWTEVPRGNYGDAAFTIGLSTDSTFNDYNFTGWDLDGDAAANTATYFAIVIGTASVESSETISIYSVGLNNGAIATRPAPQTPDQVLRECQYYYETTFASGAVGTAATSRRNMAPMVAYWPGSGTSELYSQSFGHQWLVPKYASPNLTFYSGLSTTAARVDAHIVVSTGSSNAEVVYGTFWSTQTISTQGFFTLPAVVAGPTSMISGATAGQPGSGYILYHYVADARLGII